MERNRPYFSLISLFVITLAATGVWFLMEKEAESASGEAAITIEHVLQLTQARKVKLHENISGVLFDVPFTPQAPFGNWSDPRQQNGCEEAVALMAMKWVRGETFTPEEAERDIIAISEYEKKSYGHHHDTSAEDTVKRIFHGYFGYRSVEVKQAIGREDIKTALREGDLVLVPVNGRLLENPFYTPPGPLEHMVVVRGYDPERKEFITNDPGTRHGQNFRYLEDVLENALQNYPSGFHKPIVSVNKVMIVVNPALDRRAFKGGVKSAF